ncbi:MAG: phosphate ABC transporter substrate-binding protein PstS [Synechococcaceae bacterium WB9_2_112]|jgi:phosphate transport system substrate-binding protein|nr:phosphate ABC transporter substrate-binding protein PstS [Synechococcaceae bacterium WB9_2_112]
MTFAKKAFTTAAFSAAAAGIALPVLAQATINGAGASFPAAFYQRAFAGVANTVRVNYQSVGSGAGVRQFVAGSVDFGATDEPIKPSEAAKVKRGVVQFPAIGGTIAVAFNKADCKSLNLTQKQVVDVFLGNIKTWDQLKCGKGPITIAHRSDGSGTTFAFTNSLSAFSSEWKSKVGEGKSVKWPVGVGGKGNEGVAGVISNTPGAIGYLNQAYVKGAIKAAAVQNKAGKFVMPSEASGAAALNNITLDDNLAGEDPNPAGANSYPISTLTWILAYKTGNGDKAPAIREAMLYLLSPRAQNQAESLGYVPLKGSVLKASKQAVGTIGR